MKLPGLTARQTLYTEQILSQAMNHSSEAILRKPEIELAGYLNFSSNWSAPSTVNMSTRSATNCVMTCNNIATYSNLSGNSGATVVAGPHTTSTDNKLHLTVRLYKNGAHTKSCHVYVGKNSRCDGNCNCNYVD